MAGNRTELLLTMISKAMGDLDKGMSQSCKRIEDALLMRIGDLRERWERTSGAESAKITLEYLQRGSSPLLTDLDIEHSRKRQYAALAVLNVEAHFGYACTALDVLLASIKSVLILDYKDNNCASVMSNSARNERVIKMRPHTLGAVRPPLPSDIINAIEDSVKDKGKGNFNSSVLSNAVEAILYETDAFQRENIINQAFGASFNNHDFDSLSGVVQLTRELREEAVRNSALNEQWGHNDSEKLSISVVESLVRQRPAKYGVDWRPEEDSSFPFQNLWGDNRISLNTLSLLLTKAVIPNVSVSIFLLYMCNHIRATIRAIKVILFSGGDSTDIYFEKVQFSSWCTWLDLYYRLEWFILTARYMLFIYAKKDLFLNERHSHQEKECGLGLMAAATESIPPNLMADRWLTDILFQWPRDDRKVFDSITAETILGCALWTSPGARHTVFGRVNTGKYAIVNRISIDSAHFCVSVLLGRALDEEVAGTKMLVAPSSAGLRDNGVADDDIGSNNNNTKSLGVMPSDIIIDRSNARDNGNCSPFVSNATYLMRKIWDIESTDARTGIDIAVIASGILSSLEPLLYNSGDTVAGKEWTCLKLLGHEYAPSLIHNAWDTVLQGRDKLKIAAKTQKRLTDAAKSMQESLEKKNSEKEKAAREVEELLCTTIADIQESNINCSLSAECGLYATSVWKKATTSILTSLAAFPE
uniref:Wsv220-like protein n=1 Tax=Trachysalambria curvirostris nimavirus TaxID=2984282 RepID=A0A9C7BIW2_9VIRU|nr:MAG: wsv220-like protein [Trachysalambria curvirostris nimavirus]